MTGTDYTLSTHKSVPVIPEPPCISLLFSADSKSTKDKFSGSLIVRCCVFIMFRTLCPISNSSCLISSVYVE
jgi:hypothetical protein